MTDLVLEGLMKRRKELVAEVRRCEARLQGLFTDIDNVDGVISQFDPAYKAIYPQIRGVGLSGHLTKTLLGILRKSPEPMTIRTMTIAMMMNLGLDHQDRKRVARAMEQTRTAMARQKRNGTVVSEIGPNHATMWWIAS